MKLWGYNGKIIGNVIGNDGKIMGSTQRFMKFFLGLLFSRSGVKQKETWIFQGQYKNKKRPYVARKMCATQGLKFLFFSWDFSECPGLPF